MPYSNRLWTFLSLAALLAAALVAGGCNGGGEGAGSTTGTSGGKATSKRFLKLGTAPVGGAFFVVGGALAEVINDKKPESLGKFTAVATKGSQQNIRDLDQGQLNFALSNAAITYFAVRGEEGWDKKYDVKSVMTLAPNVAMFITTENSGVKVMADLKGKRVSVGPAGAGFEYFLKPLLNAHGISYDDFTPLNASQTDAVDQLGDGSAAAAFLGGAVPTSSIVQASSSMDVHFIPFDPAVTAKLIEEYAFFQPATIKAGAYSDLKEDFEGMNVGSMHLITTAGEDEELVYLVTKTIFENREEVVKKHAAGKAINPKNVVQFVGTEFHPGAIRFYKEIGIWPEDGVAPQEAAESPADNKPQPSADKEGE